MRQTLSFPDLRSIRAFQFLIALALAAPVLAQGRGMGPSGGGGDSVGSLPSTAGAPPSPANAGTPSVQDALAPHLVLIGTPQELSRIVADVSGPGTWSVEAIPGKGLARMTFVGHVSVVLDRQVFAKSFADASLEVGSIFAGGTAQIRVDGRLRATQVLKEGPIGLRLQQSARTGLIDRGLSFSLRGAFETRAALSIQGAGNLIRIEQR